MGDQALVQVAGEQGDAVRAGVVAEQVAGHADLAAATGAEHVLIELGPVFDGVASGGPQAGMGDRHHGDSFRRTSVLTGVRQLRQQVRFAPLADCRALPLRSDGGFYLAATSPLIGAFRLASPS